MSDEQAAVISEWLRDHEETITAACSSDIKMNTFLGRGIHGLVEFHVFSCVLSIIFQTNSCGFFVCFPGEIALSSILRSKTIFFGCHSILREKISASFQFSTGHI